MSDVYMSTYVRVLIEVTSVESALHRVSQDLLVSKKCNDNPGRTSKVYNFSFDYEEANKTVFISREE